MASRIPTPVRDHLVEALYADLVGPFAGAREHATSTELVRNPSDWYRSEHGERIGHLRALHLEMDRAVLEAYATETGDPTWPQIEVPPFTTPQTPAEKSFHQGFEDHVLDKLFELNAVRAIVAGGSRPGGDG